LAQSGLPIAFTYVGSKADITQTSENGRLWPKADIESAGRRTTDTWRY